MAQSFQIVSPRLLTAQVRIYAHVAGSARERFSLPVGDVLFGLGVSVLFGHSEVNHMDDIGRLAVRATDQEVVRLDVSVDEVLFVDGLDSRQL